VVRFGGVKGFEFCSRIVCEGFAMSKSVNPVFRVVLCFSIDVQGPTRAYICEVYNDNFKLPELGIVGANGAGNPRYFKSPRSDFEDRACEFVIVHKLEHQQAQTCNEEIETKKQTSNSK